MSPKWPEKIKQNLPPCLLQEQTAALCYVVYAQNDPFHRRVMSLKGHLLPLIFSSGLRCTPPGQFQPGIFAASMSKKQKKTLYIHSYSYISLNTVTSHFTHSIYGKKKTNRSLYDLAPLFLPGKTLLKHNTEDGDNTYITCRP